MKRKNKFLLITLVSILTICIINKSISILSTMKNKLYSYNAQYFQWRFGKIYYTKQGKGSPILLVHNLNTLYSDTEWSQIIKKLQSKHTVYTIDLLGCGRSDKPKLTYTSYLYVQLITDFIKNIIKEPTNVVTTGHSSSFITMACYQNPELFNKLLYINPESIKTLNRCPRKRNQINKVLLESPIIGTLLYNIIHSKFAILKRFNKSFIKKTASKQKFLDILHESSHLNIDGSKYLFASIKNLYTNINMVNALKQINNSIYIISTDSKVDVVDEYISINSSIETSNISNSGIYPHMELPNQVQDVFDIYFN
ncbi:pimeloyl-ACP methyl ester carboxylesterase [Natranaerovirga pectinivora]|uniref:Pimeloyl-ACP methyl ester carboxylesterase n=1 Tax=Natranaerovirga pectinivora TaxID=682400 RepID=A0A4R3MEM6_9FIRM|nr:alpha/beta fold hydrolase [Natranaerovirga pectinivora]TCT12251.1 pimeloyl-ACP methyl ester carboxylesterase [Natranaerovirga pectinivora]